MKKITIYIVLVVLCLNLAAQAQKNTAIDVTTKGIQIGQQVPDITITGLHNYKDKDGKTATTAKISDFKGKLLILDFWATWCSPCVAMIPKMDSLQMQFGDKVQFLSLTYQIEKEVLSFLEKYEEQGKKHYDLPVVTGEKDLHKLFPHIYLPHYVWIDGNGVVKAITEHKDVNNANIEKILQGTIALEQKKDAEIAFDKTKPFLLNGNGGDGATLLYHSVFTGYIDGLESGYNFTSNFPGKGRKITGTNMTILQLLRLAYGDGKLHFGGNRLMLKTRDSINLMPRNIKRQEAINWLRNNNGFCYELIVPPAQSPNIFTLMQEDLSKLFTNYTARVEQKKTMCYVLKRTSKEDKLHSKGGDMQNEFSSLGCKMSNSKLNVLIMRLDAFYMQLSPYPIVDGTGYTGSIDLEINANLSNLPAINQQLTKYDLEIVAQEWETNMLVIADTEAQRRK